MFATILGSLASQLWVAYAFAFLLGIAATVPPSTEALRWSAASMPVIGVRLAIVGLTLFAGLAPIGLLTGIEWYASVATALLFAWPLLLPRSHPRRDSVLLGINTLLVIGLATTIGLEVLADPVSLVGIWGMAGLGVSLTIALALAISRPAGWPFYAAGYLALAGAFLIQTAQIDGALAAAEPVIYPLMVFMVMRSLIRNRNPLRRANEQMPHWPEG